MVSWSFQSLILRPLNDVEADHLIFNFFLEFFEIDDQLVTVLVESWPILAKNEPMNLEFLVDHSFNLLHSLED